MPWGTGTYTIYGNETHTVLTTVTVTFTLQAAGGGGGGINGGGGGGGGSGIIQNGTLVAFAVGGRGGNAISNGSDGQYVTGSLTFTAGDTIQVVAGGGGGCGGYGSGSPPSSAVSGAGGAGVPSSSTPTGGQGGDGASGSFARGCGGAGGGSLGGVGASEGAGGDGPPAVLPQAGLSSGDGGDGALFAVGYAPAQGGTLTTGGARSTAGLNKAGGGGAAGGDGGDDGSHNGGVGGGVGTGAGTGLGGAPSSPTYYGGKSGLVTIVFPSSFVVNGSGLFTFSGAGSVSGGGSVTSSGGRITFAGSASHTTGGGITGSGLLSFSGAGRIAASGSATGNALLSFDGFSLLGWQALPSDYVKHLGDITITWSPDLGRGDWTLAPDGDLLTGQDLVTSVLVSLFSDRVAADDDMITDGTTDRRGWWNDDGTVDGNIGSRLWLLMRAKQSDETLERAKAYILESLQWLIDDQVASQVSVTCSWVRRSMLGAEVTIFRGKTPMIILKYQWAWAELN